MSWLIFLDLETTGTDEHDGSILEIGMVAIKEKEGADWPPLEGLDTFECLVKPIDVTQLEAMNEVVIEMHTETGLLAKLEAGGGVDLTTAESYALTWLDGLGVSQIYILAGSGVGHFDRRWLKGHMPTLEARFKHWVIDVGVMRRMLSKAGRPELTRSGLLGGTAHRALDDAMDHYLEFREYMKMLASIEEPT